MHRVARQPLAILAGLAVSCAPVGCADATQAPARDASSCYACDELGQTDSDRTDDLAGSRDDTEPTEAAPRPISRFATTRIGDPTSTEPAARPARALKVDIGFNHASFQDAARLLAEAGRFAIVLEDVSATEVDTRLRDVEPFEALALLAQARGLDVTYERGVVVVSRRSATANTPPGSLP